MRKVLTAAVVVFLAALLVVYWLVIPSGKSLPPNTSPASATTDRCDPEIARHVYNPERLRVFAACITVTGTIVDATNGKHSDGVRRERDGDIHGWLRPDPQFSRLLNQGNVNDQGGNLVFEIVCFSTPTQLDAMDACGNDFTNPVQLAPVGRHVAITGAYVQDNNHAHWMEIHPVSSITLIN